MIACDTLVTIHIFLYYDVRSIEAAVLLIAAAPSCCKISIEIIRRHYFVDVILCVQSLATNGLQGDHSVEN